MTDISDEKEFLKNIKNKIQIAIKNDKRTCLERGSHKRPKQDFLLTIPNIIQSLLGMLYSTSDQTSIICNSAKKKKYQFGRDTYIKFLKNHMSDDYLRFKKNRYFTKKLSLIMQIIEQYKNSTKEFEELNFTGKENKTSSLKLTLEDYQYFKKVYIDTEYIQFVANRTIQSATYVDKQPNLGVGKRYTETLIEADTVETILKKEKLINKEIEAVTEDISVCENEKSKTIPTLINIDFSLPESEQKKYIYTWLEKNKNNLIEIVEDQNETRKIYSAFKERIDRQMFMQAQINDQDQFEEKYVFFYDLDMLRCADLKSFGIEDKTLIVIKEKNSVQYRYYRYYKGKIYFLEVYGHYQGSPTISNELNRFAYDFYSGDMQRLTNIKL